MQQRTEEGRDPAPGAHDPEGDRQPLATVQHTAGAPLSSHFSSLFPVVASYCPWGFPSETLAAKTGEAGS